jgi:hypothetical protein
MSFAADFERPEPVGLRAHSHEQRSQILNRLIPLVQKHMGKQLLALATSGSYALRNDGPYSDLDLIGFVRDVQPPDRAVVNQIHDGLLVHIWFITKEQYLDIHRRKFGEQWAFAAAISLVPLLNEPFVRALSAPSPITTASQHHAAIVELWPFAQEATGKFLNAVESGNVENSWFLYWNMIDKLTTVLALLNSRPFSTRSMVFSEARKFPILPQSYHAIFDPISKLDLAGHRERAMNVFSETERLLEARGLLHYADSLECFVEPPRFGDGVRRIAARIAARLSRMARRCRDAAADLARATSAGSPRRSGV